MASHDELEPGDAARVERLRALDILDTAPEQAFDDIVEVAAALCDTPIALVSLLDGHRQWFKARVGLDLAETPIDQSVCAHAISQPDVMVIADLTGDPRTATNPLVTADSGIRFYAGAPLLTDAGEPIGTVCVIDWKPRPEGLTQPQLSGLRALARQTAAAIVSRSANAGQAEALRRLSETERALEASDRRSRNAQAAGRIGTFELDLSTDEVSVSPEMCGLFGLPAAPVYAGEYLQSMIVDPDDASFSTRATRQDGSATLDVEYRIRRVDDGRLRWLSRRAAFDRDADGTPRRLFGTVHDVTERRLAGARMEALLALGDRLRGAETIEAIMGAAARTLCETLGAARCGYALVDPEADTFTVERDFARGVASIAGTTPASRFAQTFAALAEGRTLVVADIDAEPALALDLSAYRAIDTRGCIEVPLIERGRLVGFVFAHDRLPRGWDVLEVEFARSVADRTHAAIAKLYAEQDREVLNHELGHRIKNVMAMIQAIASQTLRSVPDRAPVEALERRLIALAGAHDVLLRKSWASARIVELLTRTIVMTAQEERVELSGPDMAISARAALGMSLLVHEMLTNAVKYGALSTEAGHVAITWRVEGDPDQSLVMEWIERGGPPASRPDTTSFGMRLISLGLLGTGGASVRYLFTGLEATFIAPLASIGAGRDDARTSQRSTP